METSREGATEAPVDFFTGRRSWNSFMKCLLSLRHAVTRLIETFLSTVSPTSHPAHQAREVFNVTDSEELQGTNKESGISNRFSTLFKPTAFLNIIKECRNMTGFNS